MRDDDSITDIDSPNGAVFLHAIDGNMLFVNEATCSRLGDSEDRCQAKSNVACCLFDTSVQSA
jgi:hypothetical protein